LVTAGGTREPIDPVRYVGNRSSGKMGHAIAAAARRRGAHVVLVTTSAQPVSAGVTVVEVETADEMRHAVLASSDACDVVVMADPNARPSAVRDRAVYVDRLDAVLARADVVKVSTEDLAYLEPSAEPAEMARTLLGRGPRVVLVTDGGDAARVVTGDRVVEVPVPSVV